MSGVHRRREYWTSLTNNYSSEQEDKRYCVHCESYGFQYKELKPRIYLDSELINVHIPSDLENWIQCYECGTIQPVEHGKQESAIAGFKEVPESIHDSKSLKVEHFINPRNRSNHNNRKVRKEPEELEDFIQNRFERYRRQLVIQIIVQFTIIKERVGDESRTGIGPYLLSHEPLSVF